MQDNKSTGTGSSAKSQITVAVYMFMEANSVINGPQLVRVGIEEYGLPFRSDCDQQVEQDDRF